MAATTVAVMTKEFESILVAGMFPQVDDKFVFRDLGLINAQASIANAAQMSPGTTFHVDQVVHLTGTYTESSRRLTDGTAVSTTPMALTNPNQYTATMREYAGPYSSAPVSLGITELLRRRAAHDVAQMVADELRRDFMKVEDKTFCDLSLTATAQVTADGTAAASILVGKVASYEWLSRVALSLKNSLVPKFPNDRYRGVISPTLVQQLQNDSDILDLNKYQKADASMITTGYVGTIAGIDLYESTLIPTVACGAGSALTGYQSVFFGDGGPIARIPAVEPEIRTLYADDFKRQLCVLNYWMCAYSALDLTWIVKGLCT